MRRTVGALTGCGCAYRNAVEFAASQPELTLRPEPPSTLTKVNEMRKTYLGGYEGEGRIALRTLAVDNENSLKPENTKRLILEVCPGESVEQLPAEGLNNAGVYFVHHGNEKKTVVKEVDRYSKFDIEKEVNGKTKWVKTNLFEAELSGFSNLVEGLKARDQAHVQSTGCNYPGTKLLSEENLVLPHEIVRVVTPFKWSDPTTWGCEQGKRSEVHPDIQIRGNEKERYFLVMPAALGKPVNKCFEYPPNYESKREYEEYKHVFETYESGKAKVSDDMDESASANYYEQLKIFQAADSGYDEYREAKSDEVYVAVEQWLAFHGLEHDDMNYGNIMYDEFTGSWQLIDNSGWCGLKCKPA